MNIAQKNDEFIASSSLAPIWTTQFHCPTPPTLRMWQGNKHSFYYYFFIKNCPWDKVFWIQLIRWYNGSYATILASHILRPSLPPQSIADMWIQDGASTMVRRLNNCWLLHDRIYFIVFIVTPTRFSWVLLFILYQTQQSICSNYERRCLSWKEGNVDDEGLCVNAKQSTLDSRECTWQGSDWNGYYEYFFTISCKYSMD